MSLRQSSRFIYISYTEPEANRIIYVNWGVKQLDDVEHSTLVAFCLSEEVPMLACLEFRILRLAICTDRG